MKKKFMPCVLSMIILTGTTVGLANHLVFAAVPETNYDKVIIQHLDKHTKEQKENDREVADIIEQANLANDAKITQQQSIYIATKEVAGTVLKSALEDEDGVVAYNVVIKDSNGQDNEVKVDAKTGSIIKIERDNNTQTNYDVDK